jgi:hypothetical protein
MEHRHGRERRRAALVRRAGSTETLRKGKKNGSFFLPLSLSLSPPDFHPSFFLSSLTLSSLSLSRPFLVLALV